MLKSGFFDPARHRERVFFRTRGVFGKIRKKRTTKVGVSRRKSGQKKQQIERQKTGQKTGKNAQENGKEKTKKTEKGEVAENAQKKYRLTIKNSARILTVKRYKNSRKFYRFPICKNATLPGTKISKSKEAIRARISSRERRRGHEIRPALLRGASPSQSRNSY